MNLFEPKYYNTAVYREYLVCLSYSGTVHFSKNIENAKIIILYNNIKLSLSELNFISSIISVHSFFCGFLILLDSGKIIYVILVTNNEHYIPKINKYIEFELITYIYSTKQYILFYDGNNIHCITNLVDISHPQFVFNLEYSLILNVDGYIPFENMFVYISDAKILTKVIEHPMHSHRDYIKYSYNIENNMIESEKIYENSLLFDNILIKSIEILYANSDSEIYVKLFDGSLLFWSNLPISSRSLNFYKQIYCMSGIKKLYIWKQQYFVISDALYLFGRNDMLGMSINGIDCIELKTLNKVDLPIVEIQNFENSILYIGSDNTITTSAKLSIPDYNTLPLFESGVCSVPVGNPMYFSKRILFWINKLGDLKCSSHNDLEFIEMDLFLTGSNELISSKSLLLRGCTRGSYI